MRRTLPLSVVFFSLMLGLFLFRAPLALGADELKSNSVIPDLNLQVPIFEKESIPVARYENGDVVFTGLTDYVNLAYNWLVGAVGILVVLSLMYGGVLWLTSGGSGSNISKAQDIIRNALIGLGLVLGSYFILFTINPELVELRPVRLAKLKKVDLSVRVEGVRDEGNASGGGSSQNGSAVSPNGSIVGANDFHGHTVELDTAVAKSFETAMEDISKKQPGFRISAIHGKRNDTGCHGQGLAFDVNADANPCTFNPKTPNIGCEKNAIGSSRFKVGSRDFKPGSDPESVSKEVVDILKKNGWCWGGDWRSFKDYMHFSRCANECGASDPYAW